MTAVALISTAMVLLIIGIAINVYGFKRGISPSGSLGWLSGVCALTALMLTLVSLAAFVGGAK